WYEAAVAAAPAGQGKAVANWVTTELLGALKKEGLALADAKVAPAGLGALVALIAAGEISGKIAKDVFAEMLRTGEEPGAIVKAKGLVQVSDEGAIVSAVDAVIAENAKMV